MLGHWALEVSLDHGKPPLIRKRALAHPGGSPPGGRSGVATRIQATVSPGTSRIVRSWACAPVTLPTIAGPYRSYLAW